KTFSTTHSVLYDAVCMPGGDKAVASLRSSQPAADFFQNAYAHAKAVCFARGALDATARWAPDLEDNAKPSGPGVASVHGVVMQREGDASELAEAFLKAVAEYRHWGRERDDA